MALITFNVLKANISPRRTALSTGHQSRGRRSRGSNVLGNGSTSQRSAVNGSTMTPANTSAASSSSTTPGSTERVSGSPSVQSSSILFDYTPQSSSNTHGSTQGNTNPDYYVDEEEIRFSTEDNRSSPRRRQRRFSESASSGLASDSDHRSASEVSEDDDEDDDLLGNDYEEILDQETFVLQVRFKDLVSYLMSSQEAISFPRITNPRSTGSASAADLQAARTQNLPV
ncbi:hypothetical protein BC939DRAFT_73679 [Gamsiella multidivaricata]|uniref:uncharacterized protein n=1 Tax=Gamsiella multidivaricata TaxID=101098 RepID=UPI00221F7FAF|nr:uncharacterized protein BC939DRAFT_73679 [Gamsiella multidivaricata]KAI7815945.1 hypothetical protein BC939DRAFT_73679 [Gamsiella multidivaricata]